jgi:hypothetical protein
MNCLNCTNPIYKFVEWLNTQVTTSTTDIQFLTLLGNVLNNDDSLHASGYTINKRTFPNYCCPDCPSNDCYGGTYFLGNTEQATEFLTDYVLAEGKITNSCCINYYADYSVAADPAFALLLQSTESYVCCNKFSSEYLNLYLRTLETYYDSSEPSHLSLFASAPFMQILDEGIFEYSLFNGDSAIGDIIIAANTIVNPLFRFLFLAYLLTRGLVITCSECAEANNSINIMTTLNFTTNCLIRQPL